MFERAKIAVFVLLAACSVGEVPAGDTPDGGGTTDGGGTGGGQSFTMQITPLVTECVGCHGGGTAPNLTSFMMLEPKYKTKPGSANILATKPDPHQNIPYLTTAERTIVINWIDSLP